MHNSKENIGLIILAAGASSRMGQPKQLLPFGTTTLIGHAIDVGVTSDCDPIVVVLGAQSKAIKKAIAEKSVDIVENSNWEQGMGSSLKVGLRRLLKLENVRAVVVMVCDQPYVDSQLLNSMISDFDKWEPKGVACSYGKVIGVPALFSASLFPELLAISGDTGARVLLKQSKDQFKVISFPEGFHDIDTPEDYKRLKGKN